MLEDALAGVAGRNRPSGRLGESAAKNRNSAGARSCASSMTI